MAIRIDKDGTIISDGEPQEPDGTIRIRDDGTIETVNGQASTYRSPTSHTPPASPLSNNSVLSSQQQTRTEARPTRQGSSRSRPDIEYEIMITEAKIRGAIQKKFIYIAIICLLLCAISPVFLIGTAIGAILVFRDMQKQNTYKEELYCLKREFEDIGRN